MCQTLAFVFSIGSGTTNCQIVIRCYLLFSMRALVQLCGWRRRWRTFSYFSCSLNSKSCIILLPSEIAGTTSVLLLFDDIEDVKPCRTGCTFQKSALSIALRELPMDHQSTIITNTAIACITDRWGRVGRELYKKLVSSADSLGDRS